MLFLCIFVFSFAKLQEQEEAEKELMADERETALKNMREKFSSDMEEEKKKLVEEQKEALEELREKLEKEKETVSHFKKQGLEQWALARPFCYFRSKKIYLS